MGKRIDCYIDIASIYSYFALVYLLRNQALLASHGVEVDFHPVFLGAINHATGNKPPGLLLPRQTLLLRDVKRNAKHFGVPELRFVDDLMAVGRTILPLRALHFIKQNYPRKTYITALHYLSYRFWTPPNSNLTDATELAKTLAEVPSSFQGAGTGERSIPVFSNEDVERILQAATAQEMKDALQAATKEALDRGAFGAPWLWVTNASGVSEPFFGSDRFYFIYSFLGLPYQEMKLLPPVVSGEVGSKL